MQRLGPCFIWRTCWMTARSSAFYSTLPLEYDHILTFGKYKNKKLSELPPDYVAWMRRENIHQNRPELEPGMRTILGEKWDSLGDPKVLKSIGKNFQPTTGAPAAKKTPTKGSASAPASPKPRGRPPAAPSTPLNTVLTPDTEPTNGTEPGASAKPASTTAAKPASPSVSKPAGPGAVKPAILAAAKPASPAAAKPAILAAAKPASPAAAKPAILAAAKSASPVSVATTTTSSPASKQAPWSKEGTASGPPKPFGTRTPFQAKAAVTSPPVVPGTQQGSKSQMFVGKDADDNAGSYVIPYGKYKGQSVRHIYENDLPYLKWLEENGKMIPAVKEAWEWLKRGPASSA